MVKFQIQKVFSEWLVKNGPWESAESGKCCKIRIAFGVFFLSLYCSFFYSGIRPGLLCKVMLLGRTCFSVHFVWLFAFQSSSGLTALQKLW